MGRKLFKNTIMGLIYQMATIVAGFILPRLILIYYGSDVNGLVSSITHFLQIITFLEMGVGAVVQSSLYKPLAQKDNMLISQVVVSGRRFYRWIGRVLLIYVIILVIFYPQLINANYNYLHTILLIVAISISSFAQYYFGIVDGILLNADQKGYVLQFFQVFALVISTALGAALIILGAPIYIVKLSISIIFVIRPLIVRRYIKQNYSIDYKIKYESEPIAQKWNGIAQHIAATVLDGTDVIVLTIFSTLSNVSIYSVYGLVVSGVRSLFTMLTGGVQALLGELWAREETEKINSVFGWLEWVIHTFVVLIFGCTGMLIVPFVIVYTNGVTDINYSQPLFAVLITAAQACYCLRLPYHIMIKASGHYKETQRCHVIATILNITISVIMVFSLGLVGVAIGTLVTMLYQTIWMAIYNSKNLECWPIKKLIKQFVVDFVTVLIGIIATSWIKLSTVSYASWIKMGLITFAIWLAIIIAINVLLYRDKMNKVFAMIKKCRE